jgi:predicted metal-binding membrane protein
MSITTVRVVHSGIRDKLRRIGWRYPEWWVVMAAAVAWMVMAGMSHPTGMSHPHASHTGITPGGGHGQGTLGMVAMVIAMMLPLTLANVRHLALSSLWRRRHRAIAAFLVGFIAVWIVVQTAIVGGMWGVLAPLVGWETMGGIAMVTAALWEVSPIKRQRLRRCHRTVPLAPRGWRADADCAHYGLTTGFSCVTMCWALMVAAAAFSHSFMVMAVLFGVQMSGRYQRRPSPVLVALAVLGVCLLSFAADFPIIRVGQSHSIH